VRCFPDVFRVIVDAFITPAEADRYIAGCIILAAAPCTAMVFVSARDHPGVGRSQADFNE
jgi:ACR3 family arsenite efflux pump ArsB